MVSTPNNPKRCPGCERPFSEDASERVGPFCSPRCRWTDLGKWFGEEYVVAGDRPLDFEG